MSSSASRRAILYGVATLPLAGGASLASASDLASDVNADAEVLAAVARYQAAEQAIEVADDEQAEAYARCRALGDPAVPETLYERSIDRDLNIGGAYHQTTKDGPRWYVQTNVEKLQRRPRWREVYRDPTEEECRRSGHVIGVDRIVGQEPWPEAQARADEIIAAWKWLVAERHRVKEVSGANATELALTAARAELEASGKSLALVRVTTLPGLQLKAAVVAGWYASIDDMNDEIESEYPMSALALSSLRDIAYPDVLSEGTV